MTAEEPPDLERFRKLNTLLDAALDRPAESRDAFLKAQCGESEELLTEARELLAFNDAPDTLLDQPAPVDASISRAAAGDKPEAWKQFLEQIGSSRGTWDRYKNQGELGRGGMGLILKVRDRDLRRTLAMKVIHCNQAGKSSAGVSGSLGRFLEEAQITSQLDHPGIVPVHEMGIDPDGRVYFTMKLVKGNTLTEVFEMVKWGEDDWNPTRALQVLLRACEALAYAHAKRVIHRNLKPANIMVGRFGETYVMDWGLARLVDEPSGPAQSQELRAVQTVVDTDRRSLLGHEPDSNQQTMDGDVVGTPIYMAPEQAGGQHQRVGPTADVYSMGAILYQLLTGSVPYVPEGANPSPYAVLRWVIEGPPKPISELNKSVPGELVAICERAMAREPRDRYQTTGELAVDLRAYLERRVVKAYASGPAAELRKWVSRNKALSLSVALLLLLAASTGFLMAWQQRQSAAALKSERDAARAVADFQNEVLTIDPWEIGPDATPLDVVDRAADRARTAFSDRPETGASVFFAVGDTYSSFGAYLQAAEQYSASLELRRRTLGPDHPETTRCLQALAKTYLELGQLKQARDLHRQILDSRTASLGRQHPDTLSSMLDLAKAEGALLHHAEAARLRELVVEQRTAGLGALAEATLEARCSLARSWIGIGREDEAEQVLQEILDNQGVSERLKLKCRSGLSEVLLNRQEYEASAALEEQVFKAYQQRLGDLHPDTLESRDALASSLWSLHQYDRVLEIDRQIREQRQKVLGETHPDSLLSMVYEAHDLLKLERSEEAMKLGRQALGTAQSIHGPKHPSTIQITITFLRMLRENQQNTEGEALAHSLLTLLQETLGADHSTTLEAELELARMLEANGEYAQAEPLWQHLVATKRADLGPDHPRTISVLYQLASSLYAQKKFAESEPLDREILSLRRRVLGAGHPDTLRALRDVRNTLVKLEQFDEAEQLGRELVAKCTEALGPDESLTLQAVADLGALLSKREKHVEAELLLRESLAQCRRVHGEQHPDTLLALKELRRTLTRLGRIDEAEQLGRELLAASTEAFGLDHATTMQAMIDLAGLLTNQKKYTEVEEFDRQAVEYCLREYGAEDPETLSARINLANTLRELERFDDALDQYREVADSGLDLPKVFEAKDRLADLLEDRRLYGETLPLRRAVLSNYRSVYGEESAEALKALRELEIALEQLELQDELEQVQREVVELLAKQKGLEDVSTQNARLYLARTLRENAKLDEAERNIEEVLKLRGESLGQDHPDTLNARTDLALLHADREQFGQAEAILREVVAVPLPESGERSTVFDRALGRLLEVLVHSGQPEVALEEFGAAARARFEAFPFLLVRFGQVLAALGRYDEAEQCYLDGMEGRPGWDRKNRRLTLRLLVELCHAAGRPAEAEAYAARLDEG